MEKVKMQVTINGIECCNGEAEIEGDMMEKVNNYISLFSLVEPKSIIRIELTKEKSNE